LTRAAAVGRWLQRWGFGWRVDPALAEMDFGRWDGTPWSDVSPAEFDTWMADFCGYDFDGGESVNALLARVSAWEPSCALAVGHGGWINARCWQGGVPTASSWPPPLAYGQAASMPAAARRAR